MTATETYRERILRERPTHTKGGTPIEIKPDGSAVITRTGRAWNRRGYSVYVPCDYPALFGWERTGRVGRKAKKAPVLLTHRGYKYLRTVKV